MPEVQTFDLALIFGKIDECSNAETLSTTDESQARKSLCIVLASDGVWDNWAYEDVAKFAMDKSCLQAVDSLADGAQKVTDSFVTRNAFFSKRNFGSQADNATAILLYIRRN